MSKKSTVIEQLFLFRFKCFCCEAKKEFDDAKSEPVNNNNTYKIVKIMPPTACRGQYFNGFFQVLLLFIYLFI